MQITGTWLGEYTYGESYGDHAGLSVPFTMSVNDDGSRVIGYVRDDAEKGGFPERGLIRGRRDEDRVRFEKRMPKSYFMGDAGEPVDRAEQLREEYGIEFDDEHSVFYEGTLDLRGQTIRGDWSIRLKEIDLEDGSRLVCGGKGTWVARRQSRDCSEV